MADNRSIAKGHPTEARHFTAGLANLIVGAEGATALFLVELSRSFGTELVIRGLGTRQ
jgi:hypothetical protein